MCCDLLKNFQDCFLIYLKSITDMEAASVQNFQPRTFSIKLWPPSQSTRLMLVERMTKNLSTESIFSRKFGLLTFEEANQCAKQIEDTCFATANEHFEREPDGDGTSAVQLYAKETSKLMLEILKRGPRPKEENKESVRAAAAQSPKAVVFDISGGRRAFIDAEEAEELFSPLTKEGNLYNKIICSNRSFGTEAAQVVKPILVSLKDQLTEVDISDFVAGRPEEEALEVMTIFSSALEGCVLRYLNLSDNAMGEKGVRAFGSLLKSQSRLEELYLMNDGISEEAARALVELIPSTEMVKILHFHNNMTGDEGAIAIAEILKQSPLLEDFRCSSTRVASDGGIALAEALESCSSLKKLDLRDNIFGVEAGIRLSTSFGKLNGITELLLSYLNLEDEGAIAISDALKESLPDLQVLEMAGNDITVEAAASLSSCVASKQSLRKLVLSENELKDEGAVLIAKALEEGHTELKEVDLSTNMIRRVGARSLARAVSTDKPGFVMLNINGNWISDEGIDEVKEILREGVLGPLDENDVEGEEGEDDDPEEEDEGEEARLQNLKV
ncbi:RAN GTPase-activating protein 1 [Iris pallida]|uniref:RAN GTPase-activating protein 1 n=1 Tax=Iris pallida TaxID=29817 RepID=A0AAX6G140_IRIPA|nr:RAN GTPase-activating protein 1 [Iris pallida]